MERGRFYSHPNNSDGNFILVPQLFLEKKGNKYTLVISFDENGRFSALWPMVKYSSASAKSSTRKHRKNCKSFLFSDFLTFLQCWKSYIAVPRKPIT